MKRFSGKTAVVSGAAGDVGRALCRALASEGADVVGIDIAAEDGEELRSELRGVAGSFTFRRVDVTDPVAIAEFGEEIGLISHAVDVLINNAGVLGLWPLAATTLDNWDRVQQTNLRGAFLLTKALMPMLADGSAIVNMSSSAALRAEPGMAGYAASKAGLIAFTKVTAAELAPRVRVNVVCPGPLDTAMPRRFLEGHPDADAIMAGMASANMLKRLGRPDDVVPLCLFLVSDEARFITGASIPVDGGMSA
jgi:NAD(P)-dependent dehydrogenase (short-subunit alcohol dehydrogenase family)